MVDNNHRFAEFNRSFRGSSLIKGRIMKKFMSFMIVIFMLSLLSNQTGASHIPADNTSSNFSSPPVMIAFSSVEEIKEFVTASQSDRMFEEHIKTLETMVSVQDAKKALANIISLPFPLISTNVQPTDFSALYNVTYNYFQVYYTVDNCKYKFYYDYNSTAESEYDDAPVLKDVKLGDYLVNLYLEEDCLNGSFRINNSRVDVAVYTTNPENVDLDMFSFNYLRNYDIFSNGPIFAILLSMASVIIISVTAVFIIRKKKKKAVATTVPQPEQTA